MIAAPMLEGLPPNGAARLLSFTCGEADARRAADLVVEVFDPAEIAAAAFEDEASPTVPKPWRVEIYLGQSIDDDDVRRLLESALSAEVAERIETSAVAEQDWVARSLAGLAPVRAGRFLVHGSHDRPRVCGNDVALEIEAALAFGTGHHGTTRGCLLVLDDVLKRRRPVSVVDLGTGTGVLAMAAAKVLRRPVMCGDIDGTAVSAARANAVLNGVGALVRPVRAAGLAHPALRKGAPYDLIFANILARPLRALARGIAAHAVPGTDLVLSGLQPGDVPGVVSRYGTAGFRLVRRRDLEGWATLHLRKR